jgi:type I restriction enzyme S subunit
MRKTTGLDAITFEEVKHIQIPLPPLEIQRNIANALEKADLIKEKRKRANELTDPIIQSVFLRMFGDPIKNEKRFNTALLGELAQFAMGGTPNPAKSEYYGGDIKWLKGSDLEKGFIYDVPNRITKEGLLNSNAKIYDVGTVLVGRTGQGKTRGKIAVLRVPAATNETMIAIMPNRNLLIPEYLHQNLKLRYKELRHFGGQNQRGGITQLYLKKLSIAVPPLGLQKQFAEFVKKVEGITERQKESANEINKLFQSLTCRAFRGELTLKDAKTSKLDKPLIQSSPNPQ